MSCNLVRFIGGGRWATIVLIELFKTFPKVKVDWIYSLDVRDKEDIIIKSPYLDFNNINLVNKADIGLLKEPDKFIICSHTSQHYKDLLVHDNGKSDILIEKPLFPTFSDFELLAELSKNRIFINLEFYNAYFINHFSNQVKQIELECIEIMWLDPLIEERVDNVTKYSEIYSSIFMDQLLHVVSILKKINLLDVDNFTLIDVNCSDKRNGVIKIHSTCKDVDVTIFLSRFAEKRERKIVVNNGVLELDFSSLPVMNSEEIVKPVGGLNPVSQTLNNFINYQHESKTSLLSVNYLLPEIKYCFLCEDLYINNIDIPSFENIENVEMFLDNNSMLIYYLGIIYYRAVVKDDKNNEAIHYVKGRDGVKMLLQWWLNDICDT